MMRRRRHALTNLVRDLLHRALTLRKHVHDLGPTPTPKRRGHRRERVEQSRLRRAVAHKIKLSFEVIEVKRFPVSRGEGAADSTASAFVPGPWCCCLSAAEQRASPADGGTIAFLDRGSGANAPRHHLELRVPLRPLARAT